MKENVNKSNDDDDDIKKKVACGCRESQVMPARDHARAPYIQEREDR